jgi:hypothetical protein
LTRIPVTQRSVPRTRAQEPHLLNPRHVSDWRIVLRDLRRLTTCEIPLLRNLIAPTGEDARAVLRPRAAEDRRLVLGRSLGQRLSVVSHLVAIHLSGTKRNRSSKSSVSTLSLLRALYDARLVCKPRLAPFSLPPRSREVSRVRLAFAKRTSPSHAVATKKLPVGDHSSELIPSFGGFATRKSLFGLDGVVGAPQDMMIRLTRSFVQRILTSKGKVLSLCLSLSLSPHSSPPPPPTTISRSIASLA